VSEQEREARRARLEALRSEGVDPFPARVGTWLPIAELRERYEPLDAEQLADDAPSVAVVGRIMASRSFGKLMFLRIVEAPPKLFWCQKNFTRPFTAVMR